MQAQRFVEVIEVNHVTVSYVGVGITARELVTAQQNGRQAGFGLCGVQCASLLLLIGIHGS